MEFFDISDILYSGEKSLKDKNYWSALSVALALPSICSRIMFQSDEYKGSNRNDKNGYWYETNDGKIIWHDKKCYIAICQELLQHNREMYDPEMCPNQKLVDMFGPDDKYGEKLYELRCSFLHEGNCYVCDDKEYFFSLGESKTNKSPNEYGLINLNDLCEFIFHSVYDLFHRRGAPEWKVY